MKSKKSKEKLIELVLAVKNGDQKAFVLLLQQYSPLIEATVNTFCSDELSSNDKDDFRQEATVAFYNSVLSYDIEQSEVELGLYAKICISNALVSQVRKLKRRAPESFSDLERDIFFIHESEDPSESILEQERAEALCLVIRNNLSAFEYRVWQYFMSGRTAKEIGALTGRDEKSISNAIYRIRKKLRAVLQ